MTFLYQFSSLWNFKKQSNPVSFLSPRRSSSCSKKSILKCQKRKQKLKHRSIYLSLRNSQFWISPTPFHRKSWNQLPARFCRQRPREAPAFLIISKLRWLSWSRAGNTSDSMKKGRGQKVKGSSRTTEVHLRRRRRTSAKGRPPKEDREVPPGMSHSEAGTRQPRSLLQAGRNRFLARYWVPR